MNDLDETVERVAKKITLQQAETAQRVWEEDAERHEIVAARNRKTAQFYKEVAEMIRTREVSDGRS